MSQTLAAPPNLHVPEASSRTTLAAVLVMSFASLLLELSLTRLFSVTLFYHFAFLAISIALLGLGAGGVLAYWKKQWLAQWETHTLGARLAALNSVLLLAVLEVVLRIPVSLDLSRANLLKLTAIYLVSALPFLLTGLFFSILFARTTHDVTRLYAADLAGGALACVGVVPLLNLVGGPSTIIASAAASAVASFLWSRPDDNRKSEIRNRRFSIAIAVWALVLSLAAAANYSGKLVDIVYAKGMRRDKPWMLYARWNALSRVEVDDQGGAKVIVIDADASTYIMNTDPKHWGPEWRRNLMSAAPAMTNVLRPHGEYAIIGPGGGVDVVRAIANGSPSVTGIEINPIIVNNIMRGRFADWAYHLYDRPDVHIHVSDGRSWVRNARQKFDVVQMTLVDTWASTAAGAFALSENNLYTLEAFQAYFDHLKPDGVIAITRWEFAQPREALRVVSQEIELLRRNGIVDAPRHFIIVSEGALDEDGRPVIVLCKKSAFTPEEEAAVRAHMAEYPRLHALYLPSGAAEEVGGARIFRDFVTGDAASQKQFIATYAYDVSPVDDNAPFFFFTFRTGRLIDAVKRGDLKAIDWKVNLGVVVLGMVLAISVAAVLLFLIIPLLFVSRRSAVDGGKASAALPSTIDRRPSAGLFYFIAIGLGYILAEIAFIQRFVLFLGHPTYALTVVIFLMLLASGAGSLFSRRWITEPRRVWLPLIVVSGLLAVYVFVLSPLLQNLVGLPFPVKLIVCAVVLLPLGFLMGMPFPTGLRALAAHRSGDNTIEWAWALNAASSVLGSVLAMVIAIQFGLGATLACGAAAYLAALALAPPLLARSAA